MQRFTPGLLGLAFGGLFGVAWWFLWGCQFCAPGGTPYGPLVFTTVMGGVVGQLLGRSHVA